MIKVTEVKTATDLKKFVKFPFTLYKDSPYWVPPIIKDELETFNKDKNPAFKDAEASLFLAYKDGKIVGRIAAIVNWIEIKQQKVSKMRFGWFDFIDDFEVSRTLIEKVKEIGTQKNLEYMEGPVGFSNLDKVGVLTEGFEDIGTMVTWYNYSYYVNHYEKLGFVKEKEYMENRFPFANAQPKFFEKVSSLVKRRYKVTPLNFRKTKDLMPMVDQMFDLFNESYASLSSFVPITEIQKAYFKKKYISFINPEYIKFVVDENNKLIAFGIVMPSFSKALQKANGKLFPTGLFHLLNAKKKSKEVIFYLIGVHPDWQNKGITAVMFSQYYHTFTAMGIESCVRTPELEENTAIKQIWKNFDPKIYKRRKTFRKDL
ncbi:GTP cyclohydrolase [Cellulophaga baltica]|uniref:GTP cyclohydrolase n=1 Tax=Cellulophaga TaxID=104264 RepID=UPI001C07BA01|nr:MULTISPECIES: GTP cyclohydrolase [Cellulophaga]MBU2996133.1 GTP cyclohydrolase [Cellulophaga baltica]MDO6767528.1 GTP cyclohydrolase [Cellulophaga sp. 1_MG-2023]